MTQRASNKKIANKKVANKLVAASCAAVLTVYAAGYARTQKAADRLAARISDVRKAQHPVPEQTIYRFKPFPRTPSVPAGVYSPVASASPKPKVDGGPTHIPTTIEGSSANAEPSPVAPASAPVSEVAAAPVEIAVIAPLAVLPAEPAPAPAKPTWKDGVYTGWGYSRHGNIEAAVVIENGRIASATISQCRTRYSCSVIDKLPPQVAQRQSPDVDYVSGATQSADAFYGAVAEALSKAQ
jgi:uncharacterized protein with FMN-binding domain